MNQNKKILLKGKFHKICFKLMENCLVPDKLKTRDMSRQNKGMEKESSITAINSLPVSLGRPF